MTSPILGKQSGQNLATARRPSVNPLMETPHSKIKETRSQNTPFHLYLSTAVSTHYGQGQGQGGGGVMGKKKKKKKKEKFPPSFKNKISRSTFLGTQN